MTAAPPAAGADPAALAALVAAAHERLTGPGGDFEVVPAEVRGRRTALFASAAPSLTEWVRRSAAHGEREYLVGPDVRLSFAAFERAVASLATALRDRLGVRPGDRVALFAGNDPWWVVTFAAAAAAGAVTAAGNAWWSPGEVEPALAASRPVLVVADAARREVLRRCQAPDVAVLSLEQDIAELAAADPDAELPEPGTALDDPAVLVYTSGTTGVAKAAMHSHRALLQIIEYHRLGDALAAALAGPLGARRFLMSLPLFHIASLHNLALPRLATGDTVVIDSGRFDVARVAGLIESERITNWAVVPTMARRLVSSPDLARADLSSLRALSINSAPSSEQLKAQVREAVPGVRAALTDSYGLTESGTAATVATAADLAAAPGTVGRPIPLAEVQIRDGDGRAVPDATPGEVWVRSPYCMLGYWDDAAATAAAFDADGWLRTGDLGELRGGLLYLTSRRSDLILRGGENVYPAEVEAALDEHPAVAEAAVFGVPDPDLGETVAAVVVPVTGAAISGEELRTWLRERLAAYKVPASWRITTAPLERTATGKVVRSRLTLDGD